MLKNLLRYLLLQKANFKRINKILKKENFIYTEQDVKNLLKGNDKGIRYGTLVLERNEENQKQKRFLKVMLDGKVKTYEPFCRQVKITEALNKDQEIKSPTMSVIRSSLSSSVPYAIFETREDGEGFGFMHDNEKFYQAFTRQDMEKLVELIYSFHRAGKYVDKKIWKYTKKTPSDMACYKKRILKDLGHKIVHKSQDGKIIKGSLEEILTQYANVGNIEDRLLEILENNWEYVNSSKIDEGYFLVHADMQIDNIYKHENGDFELLDFEWVGKSDNPVIPIIYDYGNLRARAWSSPSFQYMLDEVMFEVGVKYYSEEVVSAGLTLGKLLSSIGIGRFHLDFGYTVLGGRRDEEYYQNMYPKTLATLKQIITN